MGEHKSVRRYGDQYHCSHCGRQWDVDDPEPPECVNYSVKTLYSPTDEDYDYPQLSDGDRK